MEYVCVYIYIQREREIERRNKIWIRNKQSRTHRQIDRQIDGEKKKEKKKKNKENVKH